MGIKNRKTQPKKKELSISECRKVMVFSEGNDYMRDSYIDDIINECGLASTVPIIFTLEEDISYLVSYLQTRSLIYDGCVIEFNYNIKTLSKKVKFNKKTDTIGNILARALDETYPKHLVIMMPNTSDKRNSLQKKFETDYIVKTFSAPSEKEMKKFIDNYIKTSETTVNFGMTERAVDVLLSLIMNDYYAVRSEIDKLAAVYDTVDEKQVREIVFPTSEVVVFDIVDAVCNRDLLKAYNQIYYYFTNGGNYFALISLLSKTFHNIYLSKMLKDNYVKETKIPGFLATKYSGYASKFSERRLMSVMDAILEANADLKTGKDNQSVMYRLLGRMIL